MNFCFVKKENIYKKIGLMEIVKHYIVFIKFLNPCSCKIFKYFCSLRIFFFNDYSFLITVKEIIFEQNK